MIEKVDGFLDNISMRAKREQDYGGLLVIKWFASNYAKYLY